jgi:hypothetical protein
MSDGLGRRSPMRQPWLSIFHCRADIEIAPDLHNPPDLKS